MVSLTSERITRTLLIALVLIASAVLLSAQQPPPELTRPVNDFANVIDPATEAARVRAMFVDPDFARRGIGRAILEQSERAARGEGFRKAILVAMLSGLKLYEACGYRAIESVVFDTPDGVAIESVLMEKELRALLVE